MNVRNPVPFLCDAYRIGGSTFTQALEFTGTELLRVATYGGQVTAHTVLLHDGTVGHLSPNGGWRTVWPGDNPDSARMAQRLRDGFTTLR